MVRTGTTTGVWIGGEIIENCQLGSRRYKRLMPLSDLTIVAYWDTFVLDNNQASIIDSFSVDGTATGHRHGPNPTFCIR
jgi:hypothetical protein